MKRRDTGSSDVSTVPKRRRREGEESVRFGNVEIFHHEPTIAADRLPIDGPAMGLGKLLSVQVRRVNSFDARREPERVGVQYIDAEDRRSSLIPIHRSSSIDAVELDAQLTRLQREETLRASPMLPPPRVAPDEMVMGASSPSATSTTATTTAATTTTATTPTATTTTAPTALGPSTTTLGPSRAWSRLAAEPIFHEDDEIGFGLSDLW